jgi:hypothetical protein
MTIIKILNYILSMLQYSKYVNSILNKMKKEMERERGRARETPV